MRGRGNKNGLRQNQVVNNKGYYTSQSTISILSRHFGITGNLDISSTITTNSLVAISTIRANTINANTINTNRIALSTILLNNNTTIFTNNDDLYLSSEVSTSRVYVNNIHTLSTITNNVIFNTPRPIRMYTNNNNKFIFTAVGSNQTFIVPSGIEFINVKLWGAAGAGQGGGYGQPLGGRPGFVTGRLPVTVGQELTVVVGKLGGYFSEEIGYAEGGFGGGGLGGYGGGGRSAIILDDEDLVTAGGGGGGGGGNIYTIGGCGGNYSGGNGVLLSGNSGAGGGGTQTEGGLGAISLEGENFSGTDGIQYEGGEGAKCGEDYVIGTIDTGSAGGGGGGYYGGGGGGGNVSENTTAQTGGGGGGGSSYLDNLVDANGISGDNYDKYLNDPDFQMYANLQNIIYPGLGDGLVVISYPTNLEIEYTDPEARIGVSQAPIINNGWIAGGAGANYGGNYNLQYTTDNSNWYSVEDGDFPGPTNGIAYNGNQWAAVFSLSTLTYIETGTTSSIQTSRDGINWSQINSGGFSNGYGIVYGSTIWVATGQRDSINSSIQISMDGLNWSNTSNSFLDTGHGVAYNTTTNTFVAVGKSEDNASLTIKYSSNIVDWNDSVTGGFTPAPVDDYNHTYYANYNGLAVATNNRGEYSQLWVAVGSGTDPLDTIQWSPDGSNWNKITTGGFVGFGRGIAYGNGLWVATGDSTYLSTNPLQTIQWSTDIFNWNNVVTGGFAFSGTSVSFNGKTWIATGIDNSQTQFIQTSTDGSNWSAVNSVASLNGPNCISPGVLELMQLNYTFLTNNEVQTNIVTANSVNSVFVNGNYIYTSSINVGNYITTEVTNVSSITAKYGNISDFYTYAYVKNIVKANINDFVAIGASKSIYNSIQWSKDGLYWSGVNSGGFSPTIEYGQTRIINSTEPKALLYNTTSTFFVAYGITDESRKTNNFSNTIQYSDSNSISSWYSYEGLNTLSAYILENINNAMYTNDKYMLLTSIPENPILISDSMGEFYLGAANNNNINFNDYEKEILTSTLSSAYGFYKDTDRTYIVGTAYNSDTSGINSPIYYTTDGSQFNKPHSTILGFPVGVQSNLPPTFYDITKDTENNILFAVGPGIPNGTTSLSTLMYSTNEGVTWTDGGLEGVISARSVSFGNNTTNSSNTIVVACESTSSSNTIITYSYTDTFSAYVPNSLTDNVVTMLYSIDNGSNWLKAASGNFDVAGYDVSYQPVIKDDGGIIPGWIAVGKGVNKSMYSIDGSNWSNCFNNGPNIAGYGITKTAYPIGNPQRGVTLLVGESSNGGYVYFGNYIGWGTVETMQPFDKAAYDVHIGGPDNTWVAVGEGLNSGTIMYQRLSPYAILSNNDITGAFDLAGYGVTYGNNLWVAVGKSVTTSNILYSQNGSNWSNSTFGPFDIEGRDVVYRNVPQSTLWVAVGKGITTSNILYSPDGSNWFNPVNATFADIGYGVTWNGTNFVAVGDSGILYSPDGSNWTSPESGDFNTQLATGTGTIVINESYGRGVASGPTGFLVAVGRAESTNREYNWSNVNYTPGTGPDIAGGIEGFSSVLSEDGNTIESTYVATKSIYDPNSGNFIVGGLTNEPLTAILNAEETDVNKWKQSDNTYFDAVNEQQFINSGNASVVGEQITTNFLYASNSYVYNSLTVDKNINAKNLSASNVLSSNVFASHLSTVVLDVNYINADYISTTYLSTAITNTSTLTVKTINFTNQLGTDISVTNLTATNATASFFTGDGAGLTNVTANSLSNGGTYNIPDADITARNITGTFTGNFTGTVNSTGSLSDNIVRANTLYSSTIYTYGDIILGNNGTRNGIISGNGSGLSNVNASSIQINVSQNIGSGDFTGNNIYASNFSGANGSTANFIGDGSQLTNINAASATNATNAQTAVTANFANSAGYATYGNGTFSVLNGIGGARLCTLGNSIVSTGPIQGTEITATGGFIGDGSRLTGVSGGLYRASYPTHTFGFPLRMFGPGADGWAKIEAGTGPSFAVFKIYKVIVYTRGPSNNSIHIAEVLQRCAEANVMGLTFLSDTIIGPDFSGDTPRTSGENAASPPGGSGRGIFFSLSGTNTSGTYTLHYTGNAPYYQYGMGAVIQQII
jgi:hypothetical protein